MWEKYPDKYVAFVQKMMGRVAWALHPSNPSQYSRGPWDHQCEPLENFALPLNVHGVGRRVYFHVIVTPDRKDPKPKKEAPEAPEMPPASAPPNLDAELIAVATAEEKSLIPFETYAGNMLSNMYGQQSTFRRSTKQFLERDDHVVMLHILRVCVCVCVCVCVTSPTDRVGSSSSKLGAEKFETREQLKEIKPDFDPSQRASRTQVAADRVLEVEGFDQISCIMRGFGLACQHLYTTHLTSDHVCLAWRLLTRPNGVHPIAFGHSPAKPALPRIRVASK